MSEFKQWMGSGISEYKQWIEPEWVNIKNEWVQK